MTEPWERVVSIVLVGILWVVIFGLICYSIWKTPR